MAALAPALDTAGLVHARSLYRRIDHGPAAAAADGHHRRPAGKRI